MAEEQNPNERDPAQENESTAQAEQAQASPAENQAEAEVAADEQALQARIEELEQELGEAKDQTLRAMAEVQNTRHRAEKDVESARKYALDSFVSDLLPVVDNLERAVAMGDAADEQAKALIEGVELPRRNFLDVLTKHNIEQLDPVGEPFNPQDNDRLRRALERKLWEDKKHNINFSALVSSGEMDDDERNSWIRALVEQGYSNQGAKEVLEFAGAEVAKTEMEADD